MRCLSLLVPQFQSLLIICHTLTHLPFAILVMNVNVATFILIRFHHFFPHSFDRLIMVKLFPIMSHLFSVHVINFKLFFLQPTVILFQLYFIALLSLLIFNH